jgi:hypothetical protein
MGCGASTARTDGWTLSQAGERIIERPTDDEITRRTLNRIRHRGLLEAFEMWAYEVWAARKIRRVLSSLQSLGLSSSFRSWQTKVAGKKKLQRLEAAARAAVARMKNRELAMTFASWADKAVACAATRRMIGITLRRVFEDAEQNESDRVEAAELFEHQRDQAARRIQAHYRGRLARRDLKEQNEAASKIGSMIKGRITRRLLKKRKPGRGELRKPENAEMATVTAEMESLKHAHESLDAASGLAAVMAMKLEHGRTALMNALDVEHRAHSCLEDATAASKQATLAEQVRAVERSRWVANAEADASVARQKADEAVAKAKCLHDASPESALNFETPEAAEAIAKREAEEEAERQAVFEADQAAAAAAAAEETARQEAQRLYLAESSARVAHYFDELEPMSWRMAGLAATGGQLRAVLPDKAGPGRWLQPGFAKRIALLDGSKMSIKPSSPKSRFNALKWICLLLSEEGALVVPSTFDAGVPDPELEVPGIKAVLDSRVARHIVKLLSPDAAAAIGSGDKTSEEDKDRTGAAAYPPEQWQLYAAWFITNLVYLGARRLTENGQQQQAAEAVTAAGAVALLVCLLDKSSNADVREQAAWALGNIACCSIELRDTVIEAGVMAPLLRHLHGAHDAGAFDGVLAHGDVVKIQHWGRRLVPTLAMLCSIKDEAVTNPAVSYWLYLLEECEDSRVPSRLYIIN